MENNLRVFISVGMSGRSDEEVCMDLDRANRWIIQNMYTPGGRQIQTINNFSCKPTEYINICTNKNLYYLGEAIKQLASCSVCYFCKDWEKSRGCRIEHEICREYGIATIYES